MIDDGRIRVRRGFWEMNFELLVAWNERQRLTLARNNERRAEVAVAAHQRLQRSLRARTVAENVLPQEQDVSTPERETEEKKAAKTGMPFVDPDVSTPATSANAEKDVTIEVGKPDPDSEPGRTLPGGRYGRGAFPSPDALVARLTSSQIDTSRWGSGLAKSVADLLLELEREESTLLVEKGRVKRITRPGK